LLSFKKTTLNKYLFFFSFLNVEIAGLGKLRAQSDSGSGGEHTAATTSATVSQLSILILVLTFHHHNNRRKLKVYFYQRIYLSSHIGIFNLKFFKKNFPGK